MNLLWNKQYNDFGLWTLLCLLLICSLHSVAQETNITQADKSALEGIIVEKYYTATSKDAKDSVGGKLAKGSVTYRIYVNLKQGYKLQTIFGSETHPLFFETTTSFFNDTILGVKTGDKFIINNINNHNAVLDSWISIGAVSKFYNGVLKTEDSDSSIIHSKKALKKNDGLKYGDIYATTYFNLDLSVFANAKTPKRFYTNNGAWANFAWAEGITSQNCILIAQLTTDGILSFELNLQVGTPTGYSIQFVAKNPINEEVENQSLMYNLNL